MASAAFAAVGLVIDGGAMIHATQRADSIAREGARLAGQWVDISTLSSTTVTVNQLQARDRAEAYLAASGCLPAAGEEAIAYAADGAITATCRLPYDLIFLGGTFQAAGQGIARPLRVN
jgi:hypothetical protein